MKLFLKTAPVAFYFLVVSCTNLHSADESTKVSAQKTDSIQSSQIEPWTPVITRENIVLEGNSDLSESMIQSVKVKFEPYVWFEDFPAKTFDTISKAPLDFSTNKAAKYYITAIREGYAPGNSTFGGHYELIMWGCGFPCAHGVIVDRKTGRMVHLPESSTGYEFRDHSLMLIVNPADEKEFYNLIDDYVGGPMIYVFDEVKKEFRLLEKKGRKSESNPVG